MTKPVSREQFEQSAKSVMAMWSGRRGGKSNVETVIAFGEQQQERAERAEGQASSIAKEHLHARGELTRVMGTLDGPIRDVCWKAAQYGETEDGDTVAYIVPKGAMHRLIGAAQAVGISAAFRNESPDRHDVFGPPMPDQVRVHAEQIGARIKAYERSLLAEQEQER